MKQILFILFSFSFIFSYSQEVAKVISEPAAKTINDSSIYDLVTIQEVPEYPGGTAAMLDFLKNNIQYPKTARQNGIEGKAFIAFVIDKTGDVIDVTLLKGVTLSKEIHEKCGEDEKTLSSYRLMAKEMNEEGLRVVHLMPKWKPGVQNGKTVKVKYILPISYKLK